MAVMTEPEIMLSNGQPGWITAELPPRYAELAAQIAAIQSEAKTYEEVAGVLWQTGPALTQSVRQLFGALQLEAVPAAPDATYDLCVNLDSGRRLLVAVAVGGRHRLPGARDRPRPDDLATGCQRARSRRRGVERLLRDAAGWTSAEPVTPDALKLIRGLGANVVASATPFGIWRYSLKDPQGAKKSLMNLHTQEGGIFR